MKRCGLGLTLLVLSMIGLAACGGSSGAETRVVNGCEIEAETRCVGADLREKDLRDARLARSDLRRADLRGADLRDANLTRADLRRARLQGADLRGATLNRAELGDAGLVYADLTTASLRRADLEGASLIGAKLTDATVTRRVLARATLCGTTLVDGTVDNSDCKPGTGGSGAGSTTTSTTAPAVALPPLTVDRFVAPSTYSCGSTGGAAGGTDRRRGNPGSPGVATFEWSVPQAAQAIFTFDGVRPSSETTNLPAIVENPEGQPFGNVVNGAVTIAFVCDRLPHVVDFVWSQADAAGAAIPGGPTTTRKVTLTYVG